MEHSINQVITFNGTGKGRDKFRNSIGRDQVNLIFHEEQEVENNGMCVKPLAVAKVGLIYYLTYSDLSRTFPQLQHNFTTCHINIFPDFLPSSGTTLPMTPWFFHSSSPISPPPHAIIGNGTFVPTPSPSLHFRGLNTPSKWCRDSHASPSISANVLSALAVASTLARPSARLGNLSSFCHGHLELPVGTNVNSHCIPTYLLTASSSARLRPNSN